jgi:hypothetical protein
LALFLRLTRLSFRYLSQINLLMVHALATSSLDAASGQTLD